MEHLPKAISDGWRTIGRSCVAMRQRGPTQRELLWANVEITAQTLAVQDSLVEIAPGFDKWSVALRAQFQQIHPRIK